MSGVICFMFVMAIMAALGLLVLALDELVRFLAGDSEAAGVRAIQELDELLNGPNTPWIEHRWIAGAFWRVPILPTISPRGIIGAKELGFGEPETSIPFVREWRWALVEMLEDISHEADVAALAIEADRPYQDMGGASRLASLLRTVEYLAEQTLDVIDPAPELPDLPF
jgi:hypothetical protein